MSNDNNLIANFNDRSSIRKMGGLVSHSQSLSDDIKKLGLKIKHHEDNIRKLKNQINKLDESFRDKQFAYGVCLNAIPTNEEPSASESQRSEKKTINGILSHEKSAAAIICSLKIHPASPLRQFQFTEEVLGVVATLGKVNDANLSRLLAEYLGLETMMAIVCKSFQSMKALEEYDENGMLDKSAGLHGLGPSIGRIVDGRFLAIYLENLRMYSGGFVSNDPQRRLDLLKPRTPCGKSPLGFLGFAVNMIYVDPMHLSCITSDGSGLRETLFYSLFSHLQVYRTRSEMHRAIPYINDGAISLDGGIMKRPGFLSHGFREEITVRFPLSCDFSKQPLDKAEKREEINHLRWKIERFSEDAQREEILLKNAKSLFETKKQESLKHLNESMQFMAPKWKAPS